MIRKYLSSTLADHNLRYRLNLIFVYIAFVSVPKAIIKWLVSLFYRYDATIEQKSFTGLFLLVLGFFYTVGIILGSIYVLYCTNNLK